MKMNPSLTPDNHHFDPQPPADQEDIAVQWSPARAQDQGSEPITDDQILADAGQAVESVPSEADIQELAESSDDSYVSQQNLEAHDDGTPQPLPTGIEDNEEPGFTSDDEILKADMVNPGD